MAELLPIFQKKVLIWLNPLSPKPSMVAFAEGDSALAVKLDDTK
jgi:hypothetical protein